MECDKEHFRHLLFYSFSKKKKLLKHRFISEIILSLLHQLSHVNTGFNDSKDFDLKDKILIWKTKIIQIQSKKFEDAELQTLLDENSVRTFEELAEALNVGKSTIFDRLYTMGDSKGRQMSSIWIGYSKSFNYLHFIAFSSQKDAIFVSNCKWWWKMDLW